MNILKLEHSSVRTQYGAAVEALIATYGDGSTGKIELDTYCASKDHLVIAVTDDRWIVKGFAVSKLGHKKDGSADEVVTTIIDPNHRFSGDLTKDLKEILRSQGWMRHNQ